MEELLLVLLHIFLADWLRGRLTGESKGGVSQSQRVPLPRAPQLLTHRHLTDADFWKPNLAFET